MKPEHRIYLVDVCASNQYSGNPLAVIVSGQPLDSGRKIQIATSLTLTLLAHCWGQTMRVETA